MEMKEQEPNASQQDDDGLDEIIKLGGDPENPFTSMVAGVSTALAKMEELLPQEGIPADKIQKIGALRQSYQALLQEIMQSAGQGQQPDKQVMDANAGSGGVPMR